MKSLSVAILIVSLYAISADAIIKYNAWGPRLGISSDPDQVDIGVQLNMGEFVRHLRFQPNLEIGLSDNHTLIMLNGETFYVFTTREATFRPYAGGEFSFSWWHADISHGNDFEHHEDTDFGLGISPLGGMEYQFDSGVAGFFELKLGIGDVPAIRATIGLLL
jgi:hypothetical protein